MVFGVADGRRGVARVYSSRRERVVLDSRLRISN